MFGLTGARARLQDANVSQSDRFQRISSKNMERFSAAKLVRPALTFNEWVDELFSRATGSEWSRVDGTETPANPAARRGRPPGAHFTAGLTGAVIRPYFFEILLRAPGHELPKGEVVEQLRRLLAGQMGEQDRRFTSAGIEAWRHRLLGDVAILRRRGILAPESAEFRQMWRLTAAGVQEARGAARHDRSSRRKHDR